MPARFWVVLVAFAFWSCGKGDMTGGLELAQIARSGNLPFTQNFSFAVLGDGRICVFDSYEVQLECGNLSWENPQRIGRRGRGPGEYERLGFVVSAPEKAVGFVDLVNQRVTVFPPEGLAVLARMPTALVPSSDINRTWTLATLKPTREPRANIIWLNVARDSMVSDTTIELSDFDGLPDSAAVSGSIVSKDGTFVLRIKSDAIVQIDTRGTVEVIHPELKERYPSEAQVEERANSLRQVFGREPSPAELNRYRNTPLRWLAGPFAVDDAGRVWLATNFEDKGGTLLDVYDHGELEGQVRVQDRVRGLRAVGDSLYVFVEPMGGDSALVPPRIDVYKVRDGDTHN